MREFADFASCLKTPRSAFWWATTTTACPSTSPRRRRWMTTAAFYLQINPGETENATVFTLTMLEADDEGDLSDRGRGYDPRSRPGRSQRLLRRGSTFSPPSSNLYYAMAESAVTIEENLPGYKTTFSMTISEPDETSGLRIVYNGEG